MPSYVWDGETLPVPVEDIVDSVYGLRVRLVDDLSAAPGAPDTVGTLSGLLLTGPGEIWVNKEEAGRWPGRRRFTIGHELGHWELHRTDKQSLYCRTASIDEDNEPASTPHPAVPIAEEEANSFAAALLMPADLFVDEYERLNGDTTGLCDRFRCSAKAVGHRMNALIPEDTDVMADRDSRSRADAEASDTENRKILDFSCGGKLPPNHPDADVLDDLDL